MADIILKLPKKLQKIIEKKAALDRISQEAFITKLLEKHVVGFECVNSDKIQRGLEKLKLFLDKIPAINMINFGQSIDGNWWIKFGIDISNQIAWNVVQELGFVLNYLSLNERLPVIFMPVSPPPYLNGKPQDYLSWIIESRTPHLDPQHIASILADRLPQPVEDTNQWLINE